MKKQLMTMLSAALVMGCLFGCSTKTESTDTTETTEETTGGWTMNEDETVAVLPDDVQEAFDKALEGYTGVGFTPVAYLGSQVVSGTNYKILCKGTTVTANPETSYYTVTIYQDLDGNAEVSEVKDFNLEDYNTDVEVETTQLAGGWSVNDSYQVVNLPADVQSAFDGATKDLLGVKYDPIAYLGSQVVSGTNYMILCHTTTSDANATEGMAIITVYQDLDGNSELLHVNQLDLGNL